MKNLVLLFIVIAHSGVYASDRNDTLLLVEIECYLNDTILESGSNYKYDDNLNQIVSLEWSKRNGMMFNYATYRTFNKANNLIRVITYEDSVLSDSTEIKYLNNSLESSYKVSRDLNNYRIIITLYSDAKKPIKEEIIQVTFEFGQRKEKNFLNIFNYDDTNNLIEYSAYRIGDEEQYARELHIGEIDTTDYSDSLMFQTIYKYDEKNHLIEEKHYTINKVHTDTRRIHYDGFGRIYKEDIWYSTTDSIVINYECKFNQKDNLNCCTSEDFIWQGNSSTYCRNSSGQIIEEIRGGNELMTKRSYTYNDEGYLISKLETVTYMDKLTTRKTAYTYQVIN